MADRLYTCSEADEVLSALRFETKLEKATLARIAFILSLVKDGKAVPENASFSGAELKRPTFIADDEVFIRTLIAHVHGIRNMAEEDFYSNRSVLKYHIDSGAAMLGTMFQECGRSADALIRRLADEIQLSSHREAMGGRLDVLLGRTVLQNLEFIMEMNNTAKHANSHLAIMGKPGVGKTQFLLKLLSDIRVQSNYQTHFIYFDYKGDVQDNARFLEIAKVQAYRLLQNQQCLPINPFVLPAYDDQAVYLSAREKAESFASINNKLGVVQKGALTEAIRASYAKRAGSDDPFPDFHDLLETATSMYEDDNKKDDSLIEVLRDLADFDLFWRHGADTPPLERLTNRTILVDLHLMPVLKELVAYLVIERLYKEMTLMPDSPIKDGRRTIRTILVIDEAHNYLSQKNLFLQKIIREGRSKGVVVFFASQSPADYQQDFFNFQELLEFAFIFQCDGVSARAVQDILGCTSKTAKDLETEISRLEPFQAISRARERTGEFTKFTAEAFYKAYS